MGAASRLPPSCRRMTMKKTLILGLGNPILSDDGVGLWIARRLGEKLLGIEVREEAIAGISILDVVQGFPRLVVIDSIMTEGGLPGQRSSPRAR